MSALAEIAMGLVEAAAKLLGRKVNRKPLPKRVDVKPIEERGPSLTIITTDGRRIEK